MSNTAWLIVALVVVLGGIVAYSAGLLARARTLRARVEERRAHSRSAP